jgi:anion-transporting  ArsA/GET3 family ATPase
MCLGPGGVGKTTFAAALGIAAALDGRRVVVLTIDPARRLADTLGLAQPDQQQDRPGGAGSPVRRLGNDPRLVDGPWPGELWAAMLDPAETFESLVRAHGRPDQVSRLAANPLFTTIVHSLSGTGEYMAAERLHQLHADPRFDRVIVDTPPSRHAIDFLDGPVRLANFVDHRLYRTVLAPGRTVLRSVGVGSQLVSRLAARLVGRNLVSNVVNLFADLEGLDEGFRQRALETKALLEGPDCGYVLVTAGRYEPIREARWISEQLDRRDQQVDSLVVNRLTPFRRAGLDVPGLSLPGLELPGPGLPGSPPPASDDARCPLDENLAQLLALADRESELVGGLLGSLAAGVVTIEIDELDQPPRTLDDLIGLAGQLRRSEAAPARDG